MGQFSATLDKFVDDTNQATDDHIRKILFNVARSLTFKSPVGNPGLWNGPAPAGYVGGHFRANWQYSFGRLPAGEIIGTKNSLPRLEMMIESSPAIGVHYIANNLSYAQALEDGWSGQAPAGMVGLTALEFSQYARQ